MATALVIWFRRIAQGAKFLAIMLALFGQITGSALAAPVGAQGDGQSAARALLDAATIFCQPGHASGHDRKLPPRPWADTAAAAVVHLGSQQAFMAAGPPAVAAPRLVGAARGVLPEARAPPARAIIAAYPRGPPILL
jgi:hypothetical protein